MKESSASLHATFLEMTFPCTYTQQEDPLVVLDYALRIAKTKYKGKPLVFDSEVLENDQETKHDRQLPE